MITSLELKFRKLDGTGSKTIKIPSPPSNIDTQTATIESHMATYCAGKILDYPTFDEAMIVEHTETKLLDLV